MTIIANLGQELKIIKGIGQTPGDTLSAEQSVEVLDLLAGTKGFGVEPGGWIPNLPQIKNSGLWADSGLTDGRTLVAAASGNITENITITSHAATLLGRYYWEKELLRFGRLTADFWQTFNQIEPVYLKWWAPDAPGPQYALLYKIEIAQRGDPFSGDAVQELTVSIEREPYWRGIPPGANPKLWTFEFRHEKYTLSDLSLDSDARNLAFASIQNRREWNVAHTAELSKNYIDIPASDIPGDAPALVCAVIVPSAAEGLSIGKVNLARSTKPTSMVTRGSPATFPAYNTLNAGDGQTGIDGTFVNDANGPISNATLLGQRLTCNFGTDATMRIRLIFRNNPLTHLDATVFRGRYALYLRARLSAAATVNMRMEWGANNNLQIITLPSVVARVGIGATPSWYLHYMGILDIPGWQRSIVGADGLGLDVNGLTTDWNLYVGLSAERTAGAGSLYVADLIMMPLDEALFAVDGLNGTVTGPMIVDDTGYFAHGRPDIVATQVEATTLNTNFIPQPIGQELTLLPKINNRIYYLGVDPSKGSPIAMDTKIRINLIPRWSGVRDV